MVTEVQMPSLSPTMTEGKIVSWNKKEGDNLNIGDVILEVETDKAVMEVESQTKGVLGKILFDLNKTVAVGTTIALILEKNESLDDLSKYQINNQSKTKVDENNCKNKIASSSIELNSNIEDIKAKTNFNNRSITNRQNNSSKIENDFTKNSDRVFATPLAKNLAKMNNINISELPVGSGPNGRIVKADVEKFTSSMNSKLCLNRNTNEFIDIEPSTIRHAVANRLTESKQQAPHWYLKITVDMSCFVACRKKINDMAKIVNEKPEYKISANDIIVMAAAHALRKNQKINASWVNGKIRRYNNIDVSVAVAVEDGIFTPIIKNADKKSLLEISTEIKHLVEKAKNGKLLPQEFQGGSITISNLGMYGVREFYSIINQPQSCILAVGAIEKSVVVTENNEISIKPTCVITLSADHRIIDGAVLATFANDLKKMLENPETMLI